MSIADESFFILFRVFAIRIVEERENEAKVSRERIIINNLI